MTVREALFERANSLNVVRLLLASSVVVWHAWPLGNAGERPGWVYPIGLTAVPAFFCLSGFLIARSRLHHTFLRFMWHRSLRILPALWVVLLVVAFIAAPASTLVGGSWGVPAAIEYLRGNGPLGEGYMEVQGTIGDAAWNGSLWSLYYEFFAYVGAGLLLSTSLVRRHAALVTTATYLAAVGYAGWTFGRIDAADPNFSSVVAQLLTCYLAGMVLYLWSDRIRVDGRIAVAAAVLVVGCWFAGVMHVFGGLPLAYLLVWAGASIPARWVQRNDISYGVYIYAFPVQVSLEWFLPALPVAFHVVAALLVTCPLAYLSWRVVEKPALRLRHLDAQRCCTPPRSDGAHSVQAR